MDGVRELLWAGVCWNDHNHYEGMLAGKCRKLCKEAGVTSVEQANSLLDRVQVYLTKPKRPAARDEQPK